MGISGYAIADFFSGINVCSLATDFTRDDPLPVLIGATRKIIAKICCVLTRGPYVWWVACTSPALSPKPII